MENNVPILLNGETDSPSSALLPMMECGDEELNGDMHIKMSPKVPCQDAEQQTDDEVNGESISACSKCQTLEVESQKSMAQLTSKYETEIARLKRELENANRAKETTVMRYAKSENEVIKLKREMENSSKQITGLMREVETLNKKQKMLSSERERLGNIVDGKGCEIQGLHKEVEKLKEDISAKEFKIKWTQNKLNSEVESHKDTQTRLESVEAELEKAKEITLSHGAWSEDVSNVEGDDRATPFENVVNGHSSDEGFCTDSIQAEKTTTSASISITVKELEAVKLKNHQLIAENNLLSCKVQSLEQQRLDLEQKLARLQESNSEHLHQIATLHSELAATESLKSQLLREQESVLALQNECQQLRQAHTDSLADMAVCRSKEAELLGYTQQVTEKNVTLQSEFSSMQAKSFALEEENENLRSQMEQLQIDLRNVEKMMSQECKNYIEERQTVESDAEKQEKEILDLQRQLDEARGEIVLLHKNLNAKIRELSRELQIARKNAKDGTYGSDGMSQSSRASSSSSLNNIEISPPKVRQEEIPEKPHEADAPVIPDQQILIERIVKLQRTLARKQEKIEFLQEHVKQLTETLQKKSKIIIGYAMTQDVEALTSELSEQNKVCHN
ncbi:unnamed protein product [Orchesella dallaii]|uniref:Uncharacterized protein n=1 Tax=Orchesella dallaii TaxID=48710 RepID=A0ABP1PUQ0_9HEXA